MKVTKKTTFGFGIILITITSILLIITLFVLDRGAQQSKMELLSEQETVAQIFFYNNLCSSPCWNGFIPGVTKLSEYQQSIQTIALEQDMDFERNLRNGGKWFH